LALSFSLVGTVVQIIVTVLSTIGLPGLFALMVVESFGIPPIPSEVILPFTGFLVAEGTFSFLGAAAVALAGGLVGAFAAYAVGRWGRERITGVGLGSLRVEPRHLARMDQFFARHGEVAVAASRLVPVVRSYISYPAGAAEMNPVRFGIYTVVGSVPFALALLYAGMILRAHWSLIASYFRVLDIAMAAAIVAVAVYALLLLTGRVQSGWPPRRPPRRPLDR
jgi:membrane protein DedA with SNARE-associated domain